MPKYVDVLTIEQALIKAGNGHNFQRRALIIMGLQFMVAGMLNIAINQQFFYEDGYKCYDETQTILSQCTEEEFCSFYSADPMSVTTQKFVEKQDFGDMVKFFNLVCNKKIQILILITAYYLGGAMGSLYYGEQMEIRQGRQTVMIETLLLMGAVCCASILSPTAYILSAALFFSNFFQRGFFNSSMILFFEISSENLQKIGPPILLTCWGVGEIIGPVLIELFNMNWQQAMLLLFGGPAVLFSVLIKFTKESPRMLILKRKFNEAKQVIQYICNVNWRSMPENWILEDEVRIQELKEKMQLLTHEEIHEQAKSYNYSSIFRYKSTRVRMLCLLYLYAIIVLGQYMNTSEIVRFSRLERHKTELLLALVSCAGYLISAYATLNYMRKDVIKAVLLVSAFFNFLVASLPLLMLNQQATELMNVFDKLVYTFVMMVLVMCRLCMSFGYSFINVYALEVLPTSLRHYGFSLLVFLTEFLVIFQDSYVSFVHALGLNSSIGMLILLLLGMLTMQKLRETYEQPLRENVEEMQDELLNNIYIA